MGSPRMAERQASPLMVKLDLAVNAPPSPLFAPFLIRRRMDRDPTGGDRERRSPRSPMTLPPAAAIGRHRGGEAAPFELPDEQYADGGGPYPAFAIGRTRSNSDPGIMPLLLCELSSSLLAPPEGAPPEEGQRDGAVARFFACAERLQGAAVQGAAVQGAAVQGAAAAGGGKDATASAPTAASDGVQAPAQAAEPSPAQASDPAQAAVPAQAAEAPSPDPQSPDPQSPDPQSPDPQSPDPQSAAPDGGSDRAHWKRRPKRRPSQEPPTREPDTIPYEASSEA